MSQPLFEISRQNLVC